MDELIELLIRGIIALFSGGSSQKSPQQPTQRAVPRPAPPKQIRPMQRPQQVRPPQVVAQRGRPPLPPLRPPAAKPSAAPTPPSPQAMPPRPATSFDLPKPTPSAPPVTAAGLRRWLRPQVMRSQFILTEVLQPPLALRPPPQDVI